MPKIIIAFLFFFQLISAQTISQADYFLEHSNYKKAVPIYQQLIIKGKTTKNFKLLVNAQNGIADCFMDLGANNKAMAILKQNVVLLNQQKNKDLVLLAKTHQLLANCCDKLYLTEEYLNQCNLFYSCYHKAFPKKDIYKALYYAYLGRYYNLRFLTKKGFYCTNKGISIFNKNKKDIGLIDVYLLYNAHSFSSRNCVKELCDKFIYADSLSYFLNQRYPFKNVKKARILISIAAINMDEASSNLHGIPNNIEKGNFNANEAIAHYDEALSIYNKFTGYYNPNSAYANTLKGLIYFYKKDYISALKFYNESLIQLSLPNDMKHCNYYSNSPLMISLLEWKAWCLDDMYNQNKDTKLLYEIETTLHLMETVWLQYTNIIITNRKQYNINGYISSPYISLVKNYYKLYKATGKASYLEKFYKYDEKSKYSTLLESLHKENKSKSDNVQENNVRQLTNERFEDLKLKINAKIPLKNSLEWYKKSFENQYLIHNKNTKRDFILDAGETIPLKEIQEKMKENEAIISYTFTGNQTYFYPYLLLITKKKFQIIALKQENDVHDEKPKVENLILFLNKNDISSYKKIALKYYQIYFAPIEPYLPKAIQHIQIVPSPNFANLPFDMLLMQKTNSNDFRKLPYLGRKYQFSYALSTSISRFTNKKSSNSNNFSIFSPSFSEDLNSLNFANQTAKTLSKKYDSKLINNKNATKNAFEKHLKKDQIVALLSHGKSTLNEDENQKGIYLSDGFLSLKEVYNLESSCDLLLLGTCESGVGYKENHEGNIGLARAFTAIGVKNMVLSSWKIDEISSTKIIASFFDYLKQGLTKSEALQKAKIDFLAVANPKTANPIYWAGLNSIGNNDAIEIRKNKDFIWWIFLVLATMIISFLCLKNKK